MDIDREWIRAGLQRALRALAAAGPEALASLPAWTVKADELALDYEHFMRSFLDNFGDELSAAQHAALLRVDALLEAMSGPDQPDLWTKDAVCHHPRWAEVRSEARAALVALACGAT